MTIAQMYTDATYFAGESTKLAQHSLHYACQVLPVFAVKAFQETFYEYLYECLTVIMWNVNNN